MAVIWVLAIILFVAGGVYGVKSNAKTKEMFTEGNMVRVYAEDETFFGIYKYDARTRQFKVDKFFFEK